MNRNSIALWVAGVLLIGSASAGAGEILTDMNIFMRHRQPVVVAKPPATKPIPPEQQNVVVGVVREISTGEFRVTIENTVHHGIVSLKIGETIAGGEITRISLNPQSGVEFHKFSENESTWIPLGSTLAGARP